MAKEINWKEIQEWNEKYIARTHGTSQEYRWLPVEKTEGDYLILPDGTRLLDFFNQLYCVNAGQNNPYINNAIKEALDRYGFLWDAFTSDYKPRAAKMIIEDILGSDGWASKIRFTSTGSEAIETASIIAKLASGKPVIVTREYAFHGFTSGAANVTRFRGSRSQLSGTAEGDTRPVPGFGLSNMVIAPAPHCFNCSLGHSYPVCKNTGSQLPCVKMTERLIVNTGLDQVAAIITEIFHGATTIHPPAEYIPQIREMTKRLGILWIADEILTGFGRTGTWFAYQKYGVTPDIMTVAKGISSSALPAGAVVFSKEVADRLEGYRWIHVSTFSGHPIAMAAVCANLEYLLENNAPETCRLAGEYFGSRLRELEAKHKSVGLVSGTGMLWQVEIVKNKQTRELFIPADRNTDYTGDTSKYPVNIIKSKAIEKGVLMGGAIPNTLRLGASLFVSKADMDKAIDALDYALNYVDELAD